MSVLRRILRRNRRGRRERPPPFRIEPLEAERGYRLRGQLDVYSVERARTTLEPGLHGTLVLDLSALEFIDDSGLGLLLSTFKRLRERGGSLVLRNPRGRILKTFEITGLTKILTIEHDETDP